MRDGYTRAMREKRSAIGLLMILMQRPAVSSTRAIKTALGYVSPMAYEKRQIWFPSIGRLYTQIKI